MMRPFTMVAPQDPEANSGLSVAARFTKEEADLLSKALAAATAHHRDTSAMLQRIGAGPVEGARERVERAVALWDKSADAFASLHAKVLKLLVEGKGGAS